MSMGNKVTLCRLVFQGILQPTKDEIVYGLFLLLYMVTFETKINLQSYQQFGVLPHMSFGPTFLCKPASTSCVAK